MSGLLDTGFLLAVLDADDEMHESCSESLLAESVPILPDVVSPELAYMVLKELGYSVFVQSVKFALVFTGDFLYICINKNKGFS